MFKTLKDRGHWVEMQFMARASAHGLIVSKPWGDTCRYDFIVEHKGRFSRVQVKSTAQYRPGTGWVVQLRAGRTYSRSQIEFFAIYVIEEEAWYIVPIGLVAGHFSLMVNPRNGRNKFWKYLEAWHLLRGESRRDAST